MSNDMNNEGMILAELKSLSGRLDRIESALSELVGKKKQKAESKRNQAKPAPLTPEEVGPLQERFKKLYSRWLEGEETSVREELEAMSVEDLRKFADANNLNVTAKTSKERVIQLVGFRFREKKQLTHNVIKAGSPG
jgi:hypothetical protein